jgi:hypothetical protein
MKLYNIELVLQIGYAIHTSFCKGNQVPTLLPGTYCLAAQRMITLYQSETLQGFKVAETDGVFACTCITVLRRGRNSLLGKYRTTCMAHLGF